MRRSWPRLPQLKPRERLIAAASAVVLLVMILDRIVLSPWARHTTRIRQEIQEMEQALHTHQRLLMRKETVLQELERYQRYLQPAIADDLQMAALLKEVQELAAQTQIDVQEIKPLSVEADDAMKRYSLEVRFECTLDEWVEFLYQLESSPSLYHVLRAGLSTSEDQPDRLEGYLRVRSAAIPTKV